MLNVSRFLACSLTVLVCTIGSGCAKIKQISSSNSIIRYTSGLAQKDKNLSDWHYDSLRLCDAQPGDIENYKLPQPENLWDRIRSGFQLEQKANKRIQKELDWYGKHPSYMNKVSKRGAQYLHYIVEELDKRSMPMELALLPIVESAFDPFAYSHSRASGMWQIIPSTGKMLGLKQNWWYDGRRDIIASTDAALDYLQQLNHRFKGDWMLALAAYNSGAGNVRKAARKNRKKGLPTDYWSLELPKETEVYVPRLLAMKALFKNPEAYNITLHTLPNKPFFKQVDIESQIDLAQAAALADMTMETFYVLNPGHNRWATDPKGPHKLLVPANKAKQFKTKLAEMPDEQRVIWDKYRIKRGDTLSSVASQYKTTSSALQRINGIGSTGIKAGKILLVPVASKNDAHYAYSLPQRIEKKQSKGRGNKIDYHVKSGDSLWTISQRYKTTPEKLARWNAMAPTDPIHPKQKLVLWDNTANKKGTEVVRKMAYKVRRGDSLARIAGKFNVKIRDILQWNQVNPASYLQPGDLLTLFIDIKRLTD